MEGEEVTDPPMAGYKGAMAGYKGGALTGQANATALTTRFVIL